MNLYKLHPYQEQFLEALNKAEGKVFIKPDRRTGFNEMNTILLSKSLCDMKVGQKFCLATPEGIRVFKFTKMIENKLQKV